MDIIKSFINTLEEINKFHSRYVLKQLNALNQSEKDCFINLIKYFIHKGYDTNFIVSSYNSMVKDSIIHQRYFVSHNDYMYHSFEEVNQAIYDNPDKMQEYLIGLSISHYLWNNHVTLNRYFTEKFNAFVGADKYIKNHYLEVGPGYGESFLYALNNSNFLFYEGIDVSSTSVKNSNDYIQYNLSLVNNLKKSSVYKIIKQDFYDYNSQKKVDAFICSEVLEHIENPHLFLTKIADITHKDSFIYLTTAINAPSSGHIYLFRNADEVFNMVNGAGLIVDDYICAGNSDTACNASQTNRPILIAMILKNNN